MAEDLDMSRMWTSVLIRNLTDALTTEGKDAQQAIRWIATPDFVETCDLCGVDAEALRQDIRDMIEAPLAERQHYINKLSEKIGSGGSV